MLRILWNDRWLDVRRLVYPPALGNRLAEYFERLAARHQLALEAEEAEARDGDFWLCRFPDAGERLDGRSVAWASGLTLPIAIQRLRLASVHADQAEADEADFHRWDATETAMPDLTGAA